MSDLNTLSPQDVCTYLRGIYDRLRYYDELYDAACHNVGFIRTIFEIIKASFQTVLGIIGIAIITGAVIFVIFLVDFLFKNPVSTFIVDHSNAIINIFAYGFGGLGLITVIMPIITKYRAIKNMSTAKKEFKSPEFTQFYQTQAALLGAKYCTADAVASFIDYLENGRCATLSDAKNLYENDLAAQKRERPLCAVSMLYK